jgi:3',5'-cyclic-AMP phosphodiesterase
MRLVHLTDIHLEPEVAPVVAEAADVHPGRAGTPRVDAANGLLRCLRAIHDLSPKPQFLITGGDHIMDGLEATADSAKAQWDLYSRTMQSATHLPIYPIVGNHDILGWMNQSVRETTGGYGKAMAMRYLGLATSYYSFDKGLWHFVVLDNIARKGMGYCGALADEQLEWLEKDLAATGNRPTVLLTHIPIMSVCATQFLDPSANVTFWQIPHVFVQTDCQPLVNVIDRNNVRLAISGHIHMCERIEYRKTTYICNGSVCGNWWRGAFKNFPPGFGVFDLRDEGTFDYHYLAY